MNRAPIMLIEVTAALVMFAIILAGRIYQGRRAAATSGDGEVVHTVFPANRPLNVRGRSGRSEVLLAEMVWSRVHSQE